MIIRARIFEIIFFPYITCAANALSIKIKVLTWSSALRAIYPGDILGIRSLSFGRILHFLS
jgi:hypothetical protein